jgi:ribonuclease D
MKAFDSSVRVEQGDLPAHLAAKFAQANRVAWDVETTGLDWRQDRLATCQLFAEGVGVVVVKAADTRPKRLAALLEEPTVEKVFHHAPFDLRFMLHQWDVRPTSIRCTKVASKLLAPDAPNESHSLQHLVARYLGISLTKGPVRTSDWTAASLTKEQLAYAASDVLHLLALLDVQLAELERADLRRLYDDCCAFLPARVALELGGYPDVFAY